MSEKQKKFINIGRDKENKKRTIESRFSSRTKKGNMSKVFDGAYTLSKLNGGN